MWGQLHFRKRDNWLEDESSSLGQLNDYKWFGVTLKPPNHYKAHDFCADPSQSWKCWGDLVIWSSFPAFSKATYLKKNPNIPGKASWESAH